jgi:probable phosphoglycerate mutase
MLDRREPTRIDFYRHGQTIFEGTNRVGGGLVDVPLNDLGRQQSARLAHRTRNRRITAIDSAPLIRAKDSAVPTAVMRNMDITVFDQLTERTFGVDIEHETDEGLLAEWRNELNRYWELPPHLRLRRRLVSGMENDSEVLDRAYGYCYKQPPGEHILATSHGDFISTLGLYLTGTLYSPENTGGLSILVSKRRLEVIATTKVKKMTKHADYAAQL